MQLAGHALEKLELAQYIIRCYSASRQCLTRLGLTRLGILRSERSLQGDYAEWLVAELLGLQLARSGVQKGLRRDQQWWGAISNPVAGDH